MPQINDVTVELTIRIGEAELPLQRLLSMDRGAFIPLGGDENKPLDILANGRPIATGCVVLDGDKVKVAITAGARKAA